MKNRNRMIVNCVTASLMYYWSLPALAEQSSSEIKIVRDEYGMPHIYANDTWHLFYGYGYVVAQDRLFQMEMARRSTQGTVAEVLGWICPYISRHLLSLNPLQARCRRYSRGER